MKKILLISATFIAALAVASVSHAQDASFKDRLLRNPGSNLEESAGAAASEHADVEGAKPVGGTVQHRFGIVFARTHVMNLDTYDPMPTPNYLIYANSALSVAQCMLQRQGFDVVLPLVGPDLMACNVIAVFSALAKASQPGDEIFLYWAGDSAQIPDEDGDEADGKDEILLTFETTTLLNRANPLESIRQTSITDDMLHALIASLRGRKIYLILETDNASGFAKFKPEEEQEEQASEDFVANLRRMMGKSIVDVDNLESFAKSNLAKSKKLLGPAPSLNGLKLPAMRTTTGGNDFGARLLRGNSATTKGANGFMDDFKSRAKDIGADMQIAAVFSSLEGDPGAFAGTYLESEKEFIPFMPLAVSYIGATGEGMSKNIDIPFEKYCFVGEQFIKSTTEAARNNIHGFADFTQTSASIQTLPDAYIYRSTRLR